MREHRILSKAMYIIDTHKGDTSKYYKELKKTIKEYKELKNKDKTTIDLYLERITKLCEYLDEEKNANTTILLVVIAFIVMISITFYATYKYNDMKSTVQTNIIKTSNNASLVVEYKNLYNIDIKTLASDSSYLSLTPLFITVKATSKDNRIRRMRYEIYLTEQNNSYEDEYIIPRNAFRYNVSNGKKENGINKFDLNTINKDRIVLYSDEIECGSEHNISLRIWIDNQLNLDLTNLQYNYKLHVEGYEI